MNTAELKEKMNDNGAAELLTGTQARPVKLKIGGRKQPNKRTELENIWTSWGVLGKYF